MLKSNSPESYSSVVSKPWEEVFSFFNALSIQEANKLFLSELNSGKEEKKLLELYYRYLFSLSWFKYPIDLRSGAILPDGRLLPVGKDSGHKHLIKNYFGSMKIRLPFDSDLQENFINSGGIVISCGNYIPFIRINGQLQKKESKKVQNAVDFCLSLPYVYEIRVCIPKWTYYFKSDILRSVPFSFSLAYTTSD